MLVAVTGGTGFVGSHSVAALVRAGHRVRVLARDPDLAFGRLALLGVPDGPVEVVVADVLDETSVQRAFRGVDAVLHAAGVYSFDSRRRAEMRAVNERGTATVLAVARRHGADPIVHVSSVIALAPGTGGPLREDSPVGRSREAYAASKAAAERIARRHQGDGVPVVVTYPPAMLGPDDPALGDQTRRLRNLLRGLLPIWPTGGFPVGDVRDTAALHAALIRPGAGPERWFSRGRYLSTRDYVGLARTVTGRALPVTHLPARALFGFGRLADVVQRGLPVRLPVEYGAIHSCACEASTEGRPAPGGITGRPAETTLTDTIRWLHRTGRLTARQAGAAVGSVPAPAPAKTRSGDAP